MKRCPTCQRIYTDDTLRFCLEDGAALRPVDARADADRTLALDAGAEPPPTKVLDDPALAPTRPALGRSSAATPRAESTWEAEQRRTATQGEKRRSTAGVVALTILATVLVLGLGGVIAWQLMKDDPKGVAETRNTGNTNANVTGNTNNSSGGVVPTPTPTATPTPASGFIEGSMAYPSDGIPGVMVACAEDAETRATVVCSEKRDDWEAGVHYSLKVPPGRYFVYATLLAGDDSVGEMQGKKAYHTDYLKCGMGENCNSHRRIVVEVKPGQTLNGVTVGDWWADL
ncbi:MAG TPA: hypothetical protein VN256_14025 [Pyrinomonadaceae bacterium]|nr:hypothetical protein [Pyrinomonadaceae bacterium]